MYGNVTDSDRINYSGFTKEYVEQRLEFTLSSDCNNKHKPVMTSIQARNIILHERKGLEGFIVKLAFRFKDLIKRTPLKNIAVRVKNKMLET